ncbi:MAG: RNA polymerase factor sigma-32 [Nannocystaceae bacterium]
MYLYDSSAGFQRYLKRIERFPVLDRAGELDLSTRYLAGDRGCGDQLVNSNLRYVVKIAMGFRGYGYKLSDLVAEGNVGLLQAVRRFDPERCLRFMTYGSYWIRAHILSFILKSWSLVGVGTGPMQSKLFFRLHREKAKLASRLGEGVDATEQLAKKFDCTVERIRSMEQRIDGRDVSLDAHAYSDSAVTIIDTLRTDAATQEDLTAGSEVSRIVRDRVGEAMTRFDVRERLIVNERLLRSGEKRTLAELGKQLGLSRERVRQLEQRVKNKLRRSLADLAVEGDYAQAA